MFSHFTGFRVGHQVQFKQSPSDIYDTPEFDEELPAGNEGWSQPHSREPGGANRETSANDSILDSDAEMAQDPDSKSDFDRNCDSSPHLDPDGDDSGQSLCSSDGDNDSAVVEFSF